MTEPDRGESYLEIQMDRSTIVLAGLALLACLVVAFLLGSWVGSRRAAAGDQLASEASVLEASGPGEAGDGTEDVDVDEDFGGSPVSAAGAKALTAVPPPAVPAAETDDVAPPGRDPMKRITIGSDRDGAASSRSPDAAPAKAPAPKPPAKSTSTRTKSAPPPVAAPKPAASTVPADAADGWVIQVGAVKVRTEAEALKKRLGTKGYPVRVVEEGGFFKVQVGPYAGKAEAQGVEARLKREGGLATWVKRA